MSGAAAAVAPMASPTTTTVLQSLMAMQNRSDMEEFVTSQMNQALTVELAMETVKCVHIVCASRDQSHQQTIARALLHVLLPRCRNSSEHLKLLSQSIKEVTMSLTSAVSTLIRERFQELRSLADSASTGTAAAAAPASSRARQAAGAGAGPRVGGESGSGGSNVGAAATSRSTHQQDQSEESDEDSHESELESESLEASTYSEEKRLIAQAHRENELDADASDVDENGNLKGLMASEVEESSPEDSDSWDEEEEDEELSEDDIPDQLSQDFHPRGRGHRPRGHSAHAVDASARTGEARNATSQLRAAREARSTGGAAATAGGAGVAERSSQLQRGDSGDILSSDHVSGDMQSEPSEPVVQRRRRLLRPQVVDEESEESVSDPTRSQAALEDGEASAIEASLAHADRAMMEQIHTLVRRLDQQETTSTRQSLTLKAQEEVLALQAAKIASLEAKLAALESHSAAREADVAVRFDAVESQARRHMTQQTRAAESASSAVNHEISRLQTMVREQQARVETLADDVTSQTAEQKRSLTAAVMEQQTTAATLTRALDHLRSDAASQDNSLQLLRTASASQLDAVQQVRMDMAARTQQIHTQQTQATLAHKDELADFKLKLTEQHHLHAADLNHASSQLAEQAQRLDQLDSVTAQLWTDLSEYATQIDGLQDDAIADDNGEEGREDQDSQLEVASVASSATAAVAVTPSKSQIKARKSAGVDRSVSAPTASRAGNVGSGTKARALASPARAPSGLTIYKEFDVADVARHNKPSDCWVIMNRRVYDITAFLRGPSADGYEHLAKLGGTDVSERVEDMRALKQVLRPYEQGKFVSNKICGE